jgi:hypothetical protein
VLSDFQDSVIQGEPNSRDLNRFLRLLCGGSVKVPDIHEIYNYVRVSLLYSVVLPGWRIIVDTSTKRNVRWLQQ